MIERSPSYTECVDVFHHSSHGPAVKVFTAGLMFAAFAIARMIALAFPAIDGRPRAVALITAKACLMVLVVSAAYFVAAAMNSMESAPTPRHDPALHGFHLAVKGDRIQPWGLQ